MNTNTAIVIIHIIKVCDYLIMDVDTMNMIMTIYSVRTEVIEITYEVDGLTYIKVRRPNRNLLKVLIH
jgi:hypothetical protein